MDPASLSPRFSAEALCHLPELLRFTVRVIGSRDRAEDVLQDTLLVAWRKFPVYEPGTNCRAWLFQILRHCIHRYRREERFEPVLDCCLVPLAVPPAVLDLDLRRAIARLSGPFRQVIQLVVLEERGYREVAERLGVPVGTVMSRVHRARLQLRSGLTSGASRDGLGN